MVRSKYFLLSFILLAGSKLSYAQVNRYVVFFTDKDNSSYSITDPGAFLSSRAIERREKQQIEISTSDLPVNSSYIDAVKNSAADINVFYKSKWLNALLVETDLSNISTIEALSFVQKVEYVAPGSKLTTRTGRSDKYVLENEQHSGYRQSGIATDLQNNLLGVDDMHNSGYDGKGVMIGVFDAGFDDVDNFSYFSHLLENDQIKATYNFVQNESEVYSSDSHGTRVLSCIAAREADKLIGTAPGADFLLCITEDNQSEYRIEEYNCLFAAEWADSIGVDIITTSLGYNLFDDSSMDYSKDQLDGETAVISRASQIAADKGIFLVNSAGNEGNNSWQKISPPADVKDVLAVGSILPDSSRSGFSSIGPNAKGLFKPDVVSIGSNTVVGYNFVSGQAITSSGTSFSAPLVAGLAAGIWQAFPDKKNRELLDLIRMASHNADDPNNDIGYGIPNFMRVRDIVLSVDETDHSEVFLYPMPAGKTIYLRYKKTALGWPVGYSIIDLRGRLINKYDRKRISVFPVFLWRL